MRPVLVTFAGGSEGEWLVERADAVRGEGLPGVMRLAVDAVPRDARWVLRGVTSNERYITRAEREMLEAVQEPLGRTTATRAALIPIMKSEKWWSLAQDERRAIFAEQSGHLTVGLEYLPAVARRLHHCRELGEPFDFLTWFEFAPEAEAAFDELVERLRATEEWSYVEREVELRLSRVE